YFGRSLGGVVAAHLAMTQTPAALIIESTFTSVPDLASHLYPILPVRLMSRFSYNAKEYLESVSCPVLIVHSAEDEIISVRHGRDLLAAANEPKQFLEIHGSHNEGFLLSKTGYVNGLDQFLNAVFEQR
ncbi:MAG: alpha/beta hydrolase, partial [Pseudomonadota bacterium]